MDKIGVIHYNFRGLTLEEVIAWCSRHGVGFIEIMQTDLLTDDPVRRTEDIAQILYRYGIKPSQVSTASDFIHSSQEELSAQLKRIQLIGTLAKKLGTDLLRLDGGTPKEGIFEKDHLRLISEGITQALEIAEKLNLRFALDNHGLITNNYELQLELFAGLKSKRIGANLDTANYRWFGYPVEKLPQIYTAIAPHVFHTHLKDCTGSKNKYAGTRLGSGEIPIVEAIRILKTAGYHGVWCVEYEGKETTENTGYMESVKWLKQTLAHQALRKTRTKQGRGRPGQRNSA